MQQIVNEAFHRQWKNKGKRVAKTPKDHEHGTAALAKAQDDPLRARAIAKDAHRVASAAGRGQAPGVAQRRGSIADGVPHLRQ